MSRLVPSQALTTQRESNERRKLEKEGESSKYELLEIFDDYNIRKSCIWKIKDI